MAIVTEADLNAAALRVDAAGATLTDLARLVRTQVAAALTQSNQDLATHQALVARCEAAAGLVSGGSGTSSSVIALLHMTEVAVGTYPLKWVNSVAGGSTFSNYGFGKVPGGQSGTGAPWGKGMWSDPYVANQRVAVTSDSVITFSGAFTVEGYFVTPDNNGRALMQHSTNGSDAGDYKLTLTMGTGPNGTGNRVKAILKKGTNYTELFTTPLLTSATIGGISNSYHWAFQRETDGSFTFRCNGQLLSTSTYKLNDSLSGYLDIFGSYDRTDDTCDGMYRSDITELRASNVAVWSGSTYTIPTARFTDTLDNSQDARYAQSLTILDRVTSTHLNNKTQLQ